MAGKSLTPDQIRNLLELYERNISNRQIALSVKPPIDRETVNRYTSFIKANRLQVRELLKLSDAELERVFKKGNPAFTQDKMDVFMKDVRNIAKDMEAGLTSYGMWLNHLDRSKEPTYGYTQFRYHLEQGGLLPVPKRMSLSRHVEGRDVGATLTIPALEEHYIEEHAGQLRKVKIIALYMEASGYTLFRALSSLDIGGVVSAFNNMLYKMGGAPSLILTDGVRKLCSRSDKRMPAVKEILRDMSSYYGYNEQITGDKAARESSKAHFEKGLNHLRHKLQEKEFYSFGAFENAISTFEKKYNRTRVGGKGYSREDDFLRLEKPHLLKLPEHPFEIVTISTHTVHSDGTIEVVRENHAGYYSVPVAYVGNKVKCRLSSETVLIIDYDEVIAEHTRVSPYQYSIQDGHQREWEESQYNNALLRINTAKNMNDNFGAWVRGFFGEAVKSGHYIQECFRKYDYILHLATADFPAMDKACIECLQNGVFTSKGLIAAYDNHHEQK